MEHPRKVFSGMERWPEPITYRPRFPSSWTGRTGGGECVRRVTDLRFRLLGPKIPSLPSFRSSIRNSFGSNFVDDDRERKKKKRKEGGKRKKGSEMKREKIK